MFLGVRPLTEDEHLYLRLCKLGKLILFFKLRLDTSFKVIWIELFLISKRVSSDVSLNTYCDSFIMSIMSFLMHPWYLSCASACNRCTERSDPAGIRGTERAAATDTRSSGGAAFRRSARRDRRWVPGSPSVQLCERQAPEHIKPPNFWNAVKVLLLHIYCCIKFRCWMQTLAALVIQSLSRYWYPESYVAQARVVLSPA